jgi:hypothetical protein
VEALDDAAALVEFSDVQSLLARATPCLGFGPPLSPHERLRMAQRYFLF